MSVSQNLSATSCTQNIAMWKFCICKWEWLPCADSVVLEALGTALHPEHGTVMMNLHGGGVPTANALAALFMSFLPFAPKYSSCGYHHSTEKGRAVQQITQTLRYKRHSQQCSQGSQLDV